MTCQQTQRTITGRWRATEQDLIDQPLVINHHDIHVPQVNPSVPQLLHAILVLMLAFKTLIAVVVHVLVIAPTTIHNNVDGVPFRSLDDAIKDLSRNICSSDAVVGMPSQLMLVYNICQNSLKSLA